MKNINNYIDDLIRFKPVTKEFLDNHYDRLIDDDDILAYTNIRHDQYFFEPRGKLYECTLIIRHKSEKND